MLNAAHTVKIDRWSRRYRAALRHTLAHHPGPIIQPALKLGHEALDLGLETLDLALIHDRALTSMLSPGGSGVARMKSISTAKRFFDETIGPIDQTHKMAMKTGIRVGQLTQALRQRTAESLVSSLHLKQGIARRQKAEAAVVKSGKHRTDLLAESVRLRTLLRDRKRVILLALEEERRKNSRDLHDDVAQILLDINFKLLALKTAVRANTKKLKKEIAETQRLVKQSSTMLMRFELKLGGVP